MLDTLNAVVRAEPAPLKAPAGIGQIVARCLRKAAVERFQTIAEVREALVGAGHGQPAHQQPSIAVLPFANMSGDKDNEYFSDGLAEEIINALAQVPGLKVTARTSAFAFRGKEQDIRGIAEALNVRTILEGSVRRAGNRIRVTAQLINAEDGYHLWSERYDREMADVFAMQDEIAAAIAAKLQLKLAPSPAVVRQYTPSLPAYEAFLRGRHHLAKLAPDTIARSKELFDQAIALDPGYVEPYLALARLYISLAIVGIRPAREAMPLARTLARKILELDPSERRAHALLGSVAALYDWNWNEAHEQFRLARVVDPVPFEVRATYAPHYLWPLGRFQEAAEEMERAVEQDPLNFLTRALLVTYLSELGMHQRAMDEARKALEIDESQWVANFAMCVAYLSRGMLTEALASAERAHTLAPWEVRGTGVLAGILAITGKKEQAGILIEQLKGTAPFGMVLYHCTCSEIDAAANWYRKAIEQREPNAVVMAHSSLTKPLRESARWPALAKMMNLHEALES